MTHPLDITTPIQGPAKRIAVYSKPNCSACNSVRRWLIERDIPFEHVSLQLPENLLAAEELGIKAAPMVVVSTVGQHESDIVFSGFRLDVLQNEFPADSFPATDRVISYKMFAGLTYGAVTYTPEEVVVTVDTDTLEAVAA